MVAWVNLHLGFVVGLALIVGYVLTEALEMVWQGRRAAAAERLRQCWPWLIATFGATLVNPWGWEIYAALLRQERAMAAQLQWIPEWGSVPLNWTIISTGLSLRDPGGAFFLMLLIVAATAPVALLRKQLGAAAFLSSAAMLAVRHVRFEALFGIVTVIVGADVLSSALTAFHKKIKIAGIEAAGYGAAAFAAALNLSPIRRPRNRSQLRRHYRPWFLRCRFVMVVSRAGGCVYRARKYTRGNFQLLQRRRLFHLALGSQISRVCRWRRHSVRPGIGET
jgi:hypothetical protein